CIIVVGQGFAPVLLPPQIAAASFYPFRNSLANLDLKKMQSKEDEQRNERPPRACEWIAI
ncbi:MAG: hypothetical protein IJA67_04945, partial [Oscillospiraceae bacterium]|nr:hypothetical protein [Oscillospiraceae bacterium]